MIRMPMAQLDVNKLFKRTKTDLKLILSLTFNRKDHCLDCSVVLSAKPDKVINIFALPLKVILSLCFLCKEPIKFLQEIFKQLQAS